MSSAQQPGDLNASLSTLAPLPANPEVIGIGIPSDLARRRPDIRQAEDHLHAATANVGVACIQEATAALEYRSTVRNALEEVENALVADRIDQANLAVANDIATRYTALGGGWQTRLAPVSVPTNPPPLPAALGTIADP